MNYPDRLLFNLPRHKAPFKATQAGFLILIMALIGCNAQLSPELVENGYPTQVRVEYVLQCMEKNGGQNYDSMYPCVCSIDKIAAKLGYEDFAEAQTFTYMRSAPGEAGGLFRDPPRAKELRKRLQEAEAFAQKNCFVGPGKSKPTSQGTTS